MALARRTSFPLLGLLAGRPMSGYDLKQAIQATFGHFWTESFGQIYPELGRLAEAGMITIARSSTVEGRVPGPAASAGRSRRAARPGRRGAPRLVYELTDAGRACLDDWLMAPARSQVRRDELLLKLYFAGQRAPAVGLEHIARQRVELSRRLALLTRVESRLRQVLEGSPEMIGWLAGVRHGVLMAEAGLRWCDEAEDLLATVVSGSAS
ncbi:MAG: PadR family transcriptional regulator [Acidobacteria bacterium]|nr:MAG: PadR family transcriptional regulator [Acidobacteriota bacterium]